MIKELFRRFDRLVLFKQTLFGLPWLISAALFACLYSGKIPSRVTVVALIAAFMTARLAGMCFNRYFDRFIDAKNPRTCNRSLPRGEISSRACLIQGICFLLLFCILSVYLEVAFFSSLVAILLVFYSLTKRFTTLCHIVLGFIQAFGPLLTWIVIAGECPPVALLLAGALTCTITASDIIYACQDGLFDRREGLYSFPAKYGVEVAVKFAMVLYSCSISLLLYFGVHLNLHMAYFLSVALIAGGFILSYNISDFNARFRFCNTISGVILLSGALGEVIWHVLL